MLLAVKPFACITFLCLSLLIFLSAPNKTCKSHNQHYQHNIAYKNIHSEPAQKESPSNVLSCNGSRVYIYKIPPQFNVDLLRQCRITHWLNFCPHIAHQGLGKPLHNQEVILPHVISSTANFNASLILQSPDRKPLHVLIRKMLLDDAKIQDHPHQSSVASKWHDTDTHTHSQAFEWHRTDAYMLEVIFHHRLLRYPCLTQDPDSADAFFLPYYAGLEALQYLYREKESKPKMRHGSKLVQWLHHDAIAKDMWGRYGGQDHFLVMGRTPWDFGNLGSSQWGTGILHIPEYDNMTLLLIEKQPWMSNQYAIPYPTSFHPHSPSSLQAWIQRVRIEKRSILFAFAGSIRPALMKGGIRDTLLDQCRSSEKCKLLNCKDLKCSHNPQPIMSTFLHSQFCLQPRGDTPTRRSLFDSIIAGCIPVTFHNDTAYTQYEWHLPKDAHTWSVYIDEDRIRKEAVVEDILMAYKEDKIEQMRKALIAIIPKVIYAGYGEEVQRGSLGMQQLLGEEDAFDVSVREVLKLVAEKKGAK